MERSFNPSRAVLDNTASLVEEILVDDLGPKQERVRVVCYRAVSLASEIKNKQVTIFSVLDATGGGHGPYKWGNLANFKM